MAFPVMFWKGQIDTHFFIIFHGQMAKEKLQKYILLYMEGEGRGLYTEFVHPKGVHFPYKNENILFYPLPTQQLATYANL